MIPVTASDIGSVVFDNIEPVILPSLTFKIDFEKQCINGNIDETEALKQSIYCRLLTQKKQFGIYTEPYGLDFNNLLGQNAPLVYIQIANGITETLLEDDRILSCSGFVFDIKSGNVSVNFNVTSVFGEVTVEEVIII